MDTVPFDQRLMVICQKRQIETIMKEFEDWNQDQEIAVTVLLYGTMHKSNDSFVLFTLSKPLPEGVYTNLVLDLDIVDYVQYPSTPPPIKTPVS